MQRTLLALFVFSSAVAWAPPIQAGHGGQDKPNVVLILADDLGYGDISCFGSATIATPAIDQMAQDGAKFTSFYVHPSCSPTRAALMTGRYAHRISIDGPLGIWSPRGLGGAEVTLAEELQSRGYRTGYFGKWHLGDSPEQLPDEQGFEDWMGTPWGLLGRPDLLLDTNAPPRWSTDLPNWTREFTDRTLAFITESVNRSEPFFAILAHHLPHSPATPGPAFVGSSVDGREYGDGVQEIDAGVAEILALLASLSIEDDTIVLFFSDNGPANVQGPYQTGSPGPFSGWKGSTWEGGVRVPCVMRWPARIAPGLVSDEPLFVADLRPTLLSIIDGAAPPAGLYDGRDVQDVLAGNAMPAGQDAVYYVGVGGVVEAVREGPWKLRLGKLYHLLTDPGELLDLSAQQPLIVAHLAALRQALEANILANRVPSTPTSRRRPTWRAQFGIAPGSTLGDGQTWDELEQGWGPWIAVDHDLSNDLERVATPIDRPSIAPDLAVRVPVPSADLRLERVGTEFNGRAVGAMSVTFWWKPLPGLAQEIVLLDIGDGDSGLSVTVGDLGLLGDDAQPGRFDDVRVCVGGSLSAASASLDHDLGGADDRLTLIGVTLSEDGRLRLYQDGFELGVVDAGAAVAWGGDKQWCLLGRTGELGADAGIGVPPLPAVAGAGDVAGIRAWDRELPRQEVEAEYARYLTASYCASQINSTGVSANLDIYGSFLPSERRLSARITDLPTSTIGVLIAGTEQTRFPVFSGYLCVTGAIQRLGVFSAAHGANSIVVPVIAPDPNAPGANPWMPPPASSWTIQFAYRDGNQALFTNAQRILFSL